MWCIPPKENAEFVCSMEDVLEVYTREFAPDYPVICTDETSRQLIKETRKPILSGDGIHKYDYEYERNGVRNIFIAYEALAGKRYVKVTEHRKAEDWAIFIQELVDVYYPQAKKIVLVMDNLNIHKLSSLYKVFPPEEARRLIDKLEVHYTPKHGSWLNMAEIEFSILTRQIGKRIPDEASLKEKIALWQSKRNNNSNKIDWRFKTEDARIKLRKPYPSISD